VDVRALDRRLDEWASEYGGGRSENLGFSPTTILARVVEMGGFVPGGSGRIASAERTPADEVEALVRHMEAGSLYDEAKVLRCHYFRPDLAMTHRLDALRSMGLAMSERTYYRRLDAAREVVWIRLWLPRG
jgi:hypothetical protein